MRAWFNQQPWWGGPVPILPRGGGDIPVAINFHQLVRLFADASSLLLTNIHICFNIDMSEFDLHIHVHIYIYIYVHMDACPALFSQQPWWAGPVLILPRADMLLADWSRLTVEQLRKDTLGEIGSLVSFLVRVGAKVQLS